MAIFKPLARLALAASILTGAGHAALAAEQWQFALAYPAGNFMVECAERFAGEVARVTDGEVTIDVQPGGALGYKGPEMLGVIRDGLVPMGSMLMSQQVGTEPFYGIESVPYLVTSFDEIAAMWEVARPIYEELAEKHNQKILYLMPWPGQNVHANVAIESIDDFQALTIRTVDKNGSDFFTKLGATAIQMPWGEVVPSLASGTINSVTTSSSSGIDGRFWEFLDYFNQIHWQTNSDMVTVNLDRWNALSEEHKVAIESVGQTLERECLQVAQDEDAKNIEVLVENGMEVVEPTPDLREALLEAAQDNWAAFAADVPQAAEVIEAYLQATGK